MEFGLENYFGESARMKVVDEVQASPRGITFARERLELTFEGFYGRLPDLSRVEDLKFLQLQNRLMTADLRESPEGEVMAIRAYHHLLEARYERQTKEFEYVTALQGFIDFSDHAVADVKWPWCLTMALGPVTVREMRRIVRPGTVGLTHLEIRELVSLVNRVGRFEPNTSLTQK